MIVTGCVALFAAMAAPALADSPPAGAPAGAYDLDARHTAVIARVPHMGFSYEVFRFDKVSGALTWDPASPEKTKLSATVDVASIATPVEGFAEELAGDRFLNAAKFPQATFESTAFRKTDASHGKVDGTLTLKGVAKPVTFDVTLIGAGQGRKGAVIGISGKTFIQAEDYALPPFIKGQIEIDVDAEFDQRAQ